MGIRINSAVVAGVEFTQKESRVFAKFMKDKPHNWLLMRWIERLIQISWKIEKEKRINLHSCYIGFLFMKRDKKTGKALRPYRPFWQGFSAKKLKELENRWDFREFATQYLIINGSEEKLDRLDLWFPDNNSEVKPFRMLAFVIEQNYAREVDYGLLPILKLENTDNSVIPMVGKRPWEAGTEKYKVEKGTPERWYTHNGQHFLPEKYLPEDKRDEILRSILHHTGSKKQFLEKKRKLWNLYHGDMKPYKIYPGDGWGGGGYYEYPIDLMYEMISEMVPGVRYDVMRVEKFLCFYWS
jgi:hypothetical protein